MACLPELQLRGDQGHGDAQAHTAAHSQAHLRGSSSGDGFLVRHKQVDAPRAKTRWHTRTQPGPSAGHSGWQAAQGERLQCKPSRMVLSAANQPQLRLLQRQC